MKKIPCGLIYSRPSPTPIYALVDDDVYDALSGYKWNAVYGNGKVRRVQRTVNAFPDGYIREKDGSDWRMRTTINVFLHHAVVGKPPDGLVVNHVNGDPLDNRRSNLEVITQRSNVIKGRRFNGGFVTGRGGWYQIRISFPTEELAREALKNHYEKYHADYQHTQAAK